MQKLKKTINENNKKLEEIGKNIRKVEKKADKINIIGNRSSKPKNGRNIKSNVNEDVEPDGIKIPLPKSNQKSVVRKNDSLRFSEPQEAPKKTVKKKVQKPVTKKIVKTQKVTKKVNVGPTSKQLKKAQKQVKANEAKQKKPKKKRGFLGWFFLYFCLL